MSLSPISDALDALRAGRPVIVADDENRENEGDVILSAQLATPEWIAWTVRWSSGFICAPMPADRADALDLPPMVETNQDARGTAYTVSVDAADGITTGIHLCHAHFDHKHGSEGPLDMIMPGLARIKVDIISLELATPVSKGVKCLAHFPMEARLGLGCIGHCDSNIETPEMVVSRVEEAMKYIDKDRIVLHPDCGFWMLPRSVAVSDPDLMQRFARGGEIDLRLPLTLPALSGMQHPPRVGNCRLTYRPTDLQTLTVPSLSNSTDAAWNDSVTGRESIAARIASARLSLTTARSPT